MTNHIFNSWHGSAEMKAKFVKAAVENREEDRYLQGTYAVGKGVSFQACSVGCSLATVYGEMDENLHLYNDHAYLAEKLGVPEFVVRLQDTIFEGLPYNKAVEWTEQLFSAIPVGADLSSVQPAFLAAGQRRVLSRVDCKYHPQTHAAIEQTLDVLDDWVKTGRANEVALSAALSAARYAAESAESARYAARYAAESAESARYAAESARYAAESALSALSAALSTALSAALSARYAESEYQWMAGTLIQVLKECR